MDDIEFKPIEKADKPIFDKFYSERYYENAHFNFTNLYMWRKPFNVKWTLEDDVIYMISEWNGKVAALQPLGAEDKMQAAIANIIDWFNSRDKDNKCVIGGTEKSFVDELLKFPDAKFDIKPHRDNFDYVYLADDLINLAGRKYHSKKNHLNSFQKNYPMANYLPITKEIIPKCREELNDWYENKSPELPNDPFLALERAAIKEVLDNFCDFKIKGGAIELDGRIIAFTFGEQLNTDTAVIHVEKADPEIRGAYPAINQGFVAHEWSEMKYINREEDMGLEGLRKAKESYKPIKMIEKFNAVIKGSRAG